MLVSRWDPWNDLLSTHGQSEHLYNHAIGRTFMPERAVQVLPLDIRQTEDAFWIEASVPGFKPDDVEITFDENVLTIRGSRHQEEDSERGGYVQRELQHSSVHRHVYLPAQVRAEEITATFDSGILTIMVPREQKAQPKRIQVTMVHAEQPKVIEAPVVGAAVPV